MLIPCSVVHFVRTAVVYAYLLYPAHITGLVLTQNWKMQMAVEFDKLKAALAAETVNTENERNAKIEVSIERLTEWLSMSERELVDH